MERSGAVSGMQCMWVVHMLVTCELRTNRVSIRNIYIYIYICIYIYIYIYIYILKEI